MWRAEGKWLPKTSRKVRAGARGPGAVRMAKARRARGRAGHPGHRRRGARARGRGGRGEGAGRVGGRSAAES